MVPRVNGGDVVDERSLSKKGHSLKDGFVWVDLCIGDTFYRQRDKQNLRYDLLISYELKESDRKP